MDKASSRTKPENQLIEAIDKLEAYSRQQNEENKTSSSTSKTMALVRSVLASCFELNPKKHSHQRQPPDKNEVLMAVEWINRNRLIFIEKLKDGTPAEQELAEKFTHAIKTYNESCDLRIQNCISEKQRLNRFFSRNKQQDLELPKITLLKKITVQQHYHEYPGPKKELKPVFPSERKVSLSKQSTELFQMKAIALLERYGLASNREARACVKASPIHASVEEHSSTCTITQTLSLFPGQTVSVTGSSALDPKTHVISGLFPESFCLSLESTQTGFPHPIQRAGWTMASQHLPEFPQRLDLLNEMADQLQRKNLAVTGLLQQGELLKHAKELLIIKKKCFEKHAQELIALQKKLNISILNAASASPEAYLIMEHFFNFLQAEPVPFETLSDVSQTIREIFMMKPHQTLLDSIIKGKSTGFGSSLSEVRFQTSKMVLDQAIDLAKVEARIQKEKSRLLNEKIKWEYIEYLGAILGEASKEIFLQYISEDLVFIPPKLTNLALDVQTAAFLHLKDFLDELSAPHLGSDADQLKSCYQLFKKQILADISIFENTTPSIISQELSKYFEKRYESLSITV